MQQPYSQRRALWAITRASFRAIFNQPTAIVFSLIFPIIFILIFGAFGENGAPSYRIALEDGADTTNAFYQSLKNNPVIRITKYSDSASLRRDLVSGKLTSIVGIKISSDSTGKQGYEISTRTTTASNNTFYAFKQVLDYSKLKFEAAMAGGKNDIVRIDKPQITEVRKYRQIDFILPGMLGFSILFSTLFGIAFTFYGLREQLVLKRFYASPVNRINILLGIGVSRLFFQLLNVVILISFGHFFLNFTLQHGLLTALEMITLSIIMLFLLMGIGLIFSSIVKTDTSIPLLINLFGFPQMLLSGTFFSVEVFPKWLQQLCQVLPLTQLNDAMRKLSFEGLHLYDCWKQIGILGIWILVIYLVLRKVLKWE